MKLLTRFNLLFIAIFGIGMAVTVWLANQFLQREAEDRVHAEAELIVATAAATRQYAEQQIKPLMAKLQKRDATFLAQSVPTYSSIQVLQYLHNENPQYTYKDAMLNPTDPADRATGWEADIINEFRSDPNLPILSRERQSGVGISYFVARPIRISDPQSACLDCHSTPTRAPAAMIRQYGPNNGFGWKLNEVIGAQIVSVPESVPIQMAHNGLKKLIAYLAAAAILMLLILDWLLVVTVLRPVARLSRMADEISQGKMVEDLPERGRDEISVLAASFNRMQRSLARAMKMLEPGIEP
jgi:HAMP domain-containing protein